MFVRKIYRVVESMRKRIRRREWAYIQTHLNVQYFVFACCKKWYTKLRFFVLFEKSLNLKYPQSFHEKMFWLSVMYRHPLIMKCADKFRVREYVQECGLDKLLNPLYGAYEDAEQIPFESLPNRFVVKSNRGSGNNFFCLDKSQLDIDKTKQLLNSWKDIEYGLDTAEYQYSKIPFKLCCEKYLLDDEQDEMLEFQLFCFNGEPASILVRNDLETSGRDPFAVSYSLSWEREYLRINEEQYDVQIPKPKFLPEMISYARTLSAPFPHVRVDFYVIDEEKIIFGELTFSTHGNVFENYKEETLKHWNNLLILPAPYKKRDRY